MGRMKTKAKTILFLFLALLTFALLSRADVSERLMGARDALLAVFVQVWDAVVNNGIRSDDYNAETGAGFSIAEGEAEGEYSLSIAEVAAGSVIVDTTATALGVEVGVNGIQSAGSIRAGTGEFTVIQFTPITVTTKGQLLALIPSGAMVDWQPDGELITSTLEYKWVSDESALYAVVTDEEGNHDLSKMYTVEQWQSDIGWVCMAAVKYNNDIWLLRGVETYE